MTDFKITILESQTLVADSREIAKELGIEHRAFLQTLKTYEIKLEAKFGVVTFEMLKPRAGTSGGRPEKFALLTETQAIAACTLCRNTEKVVDVKFALVEAFYKAKQMIEGSPTPQSRKFASFDNELVNLFVLNTNLSLSAVESPDEIIAIGSHVTNFGKCYKALAAEEKALYESIHEFDLKVFRENTQTTSLKNALAKVVSKWLEPHLELCSKRSKSRLPNRNRLPIPFTEFHHECLVNGVTASSDAELNKIMSELGFSREGFGAAMAWVYIH